jgi:steroid delta-isomerase-like uncharacterized protein
MTREDVVDLFTRRQVAFNRKDVAALAALYTIDCRVESPLAAGLVQGRQAVSKIHERLFAAIPDLSLTSDQILVDGDQAVEAMTMTGTYTGGFMGLPPSGKPLKVPVVLMCRFDPGLIAHERRIYDFTGMLVQIGVLKTRPA